MSKILVIDDDRDLLDVVELRLEYNGFQCRKEDNIKDGLEAVHQFKPDIILLDLGFEGFNGLDFLQALTQALPNPQTRPQIFVVSGESDPEVIQHVLNEGARYFIRKPYDPQELLMRIFDASYSAIDNSESDLARS